MADLNIKQIEKNLLDMFDDENRVIVFWYDLLADFSSSIANLQLGNVKIHHLKPDNIFETKVLLEVIDKEQDYLIYAPFAMPDAEHNYLIDILKYSKVFSADKTAWVLAEMNVNLNFKHVLDDHRVFFESNARANRFMKYSYNNIDKDKLILGMLCSTLNINKLDFDLLLAELLVMTSDERNKIFNQLDRYDLLTEFWRILESEYRFFDEEKSLDRFNLALFATYAKIENDNITIFDDKLENMIGDHARIRQLIENSLTKVQLQKLSNTAFSLLGGIDFFSTLDIETLTKITVFTEVDRLIIEWIVDNINSSHYDITVNGMDLIEVANYRIDGLINNNFKDFRFIINVVEFFKNNNVLELGSMEEIINKYTSEFYKVDYYYREVINSYQDLETVEIYEETLQLIDYEYTNKYLNVLIPNFVNQYNLKEIKNIQSEFYDENVHYEKFKTAVIISDALRYEAGVKLYEHLERDLQYDISLDHMLTSLPSTTALGMAALLPHNKLKIDNDFKVLVDGKSADGVKERKAILQNHDEDAVAISAGALLRMPVTKAREITSGKTVIYIYHNHIDAIGDSRQTEHSVFSAVDSTIDELERLTKRLTSSLSISNILITADHGFIYTRSTNEEFEKIERFYDQTDYLNRRFVLSNKSYDAMGIRRFSLRDQFEIDSSLNVHVPLSYHVFKMSGGGQNYYHGGLSPQESIVPLIKLKASREKVATEKVAIRLLSKLNVISSLIVKLDLIQVEPVLDNIIAGEYALYFVDENDNKISNINIFKANVENEDNASRIKSFVFNLMSQQYSSRTNYYFVILDNETKLEASKTNVRIDIAFADDFGF